MKKGCGIAAALLLEGLSLCADQLPRRGRRPLKLFRQAFVACHEIVKSKTPRVSKMFLFFPIRLWFAFGSCSQVSAVILTLNSAFSRISRGNEYSLGPLCRRMGVSPLSNALPGQRRRRSVGRTAASRSSRFGRWRKSVHSDFHCDPDQVGMVLGAKLLLEQGRGVGDRLVGDAERLGDLDDLVAASEQAKNFELPRRHL
ncbi:hypothetical protein IQ15_00129 [Bradyrhizobium yuanmingense]|nr:hypothetical protein IQ15_00129 [Bradyrhizobium yuanmingense]